MFKIAILCYYHFIVHKNNLRSSLYHQSEENTVDLEKKRETWSPGMIP